MKEKIEKINTLIVEKRDRLKEKTGRYFDSVIAPASPSISSASQSKQGNIPPISYILYGIAGISAFFAVTTDSKMLYTGIAAASAFGGYKLSQNGRSSESLSDEIVPTLSTVKTNATSEVVESVKKITKEWDEFMELKQKEMQMLIDMSSIDKSQKDSLASKIFIYEVIDISIAEFLNIINSATDEADIKQKINTYKEQVLNAIDNTANKQIAKYSSLIS